MTEFFRSRSISLLMVVLVLYVVVLAQANIAYSLAFGMLERYVPFARHSMVIVGWLVVRVVLITMCVVFWLLRRKSDLYRTIVLTNGLLTFGLVLNVVELSAALLDFSARGVETLLSDVFLMAVSNVLIFSIWYWVVDPPGVEERSRENEPWHFLFPQRASSLPHYESWVPGYIDYIYLSFTTSTAFSPTDVLPLTRRAKILMLLQSAISLITLTCIAGSAINILAGSAG